RQVTMQSRSPTAAATVSWMVARLNPWSLLVWSPSTLVCTTPPGRSRSVDRTVDARAGRTLERVRVASVRRTAPGRVGGATRDQVLVDQVGGAAVAAVGGVP